ncbi:DUF6074 family protein [Ciceribacter sp. RN22]|uniref:DUF6074 family protein n=1 Tax=Ciceribacter sp. RN22 TaxID=2954932 RepID=UPI002093FFE1|nr:DUF6074 family protein [Ciceribacter sp. RN22]MCO6178827.1 DUF6074 family protein [Ciceribacter sp. RN22]
MTGSSDLFAWADRTCAVIAFPQERRIGRHRQIARTIYDAREHPNRQDFLLRRAVEQMEKMLLDAGVPQREVLSQRIPFILAVEREVERLEVMDRLGILP